MPGNCRFANFFCPAVLPVGGRAALPGRFWIATDGGSPGLLKSGHALPINGIIYVTLLFERRAHDESIRWQKGGDVLRGCSTTHQHRHARHGLPN